MADRMGQTTPQPRDASEKGKIVLAPNLLPELGALGEAAEIRHLWRMDSHAAAADSLSGLMAASARHGDAAKPRPVERWNPPYCGEIDMAIRADGTWLYGGTPIGRAALVRLFASILRKDDERYVLVTPVEKVGIRVEDVPFIATAMRERTAGGRTPDHGTLVFETNVGDVTEAGHEHPMRFERGAHDGVKPYVHVRGGLWARLTRPLAQELVTLAVERRIAGEDWLGIASGGTFFPMCRTSELAELDA